MSNPSSSIKTDAFDFELPQELIAQHPIEGARDQSRLFCYHRSKQSIKHQGFQEIVSHLHAGDLLIMNNTKVIPSRLRGEKAQSGGKIELLLIEATGHQEWLAMLKPGKRAHPGTLIDLHDQHGEKSGVLAKVIDKTESGQFHIRFSDGIDIMKLLEEYGEIPLPPYIHREHAPSSNDSIRYQTVYAENEGSVAAPTAGLHFTPALMEALEKKGIQIAFVTLHVGLGTFNPVKAEWVDEHKMHKERYMVSAETLKMIRDTRKRKGKITAVGTTSLRVLESLALKWKPSDPIQAMHASTDIFIYPPHRFQYTDRLITNFHLPMSSLIMLISAFVSPGDTDGVEQIKRVYNEAIKYEYRFFSYGDAMLIDS